MERSQKQIEFDTLRSFVSGMRIDMGLLERGIIDIQFDKFWIRYLKYASLVPYERLDLYVNLINVSDKLDEINPISTLSSLKDSNDFYGFFCPPYDDEDKEFFLNFMSYELTNSFLEKKVDRVENVAQTIKKGLDISYGVRLKCLLDDYEYFAEISTKEDYPFRLGWVLWAIYADKVGREFYKEEKEREYHIESRRIMADGFDLLDKNKEEGSFLLRLASAMSPELKDEIKNYFLK